MPIHVETDRFPIVIVRWQGVNRDADVVAYLRTMTGVVQRPEPKVVIYDALTALIPNPVQRRLQGDWLIANAATMKRWGVGTAFVLSSGVMRGALTAVLWIAPVPNGHLVASSVDEALAWAEPRLREAQRIEADRANAQAR